MKIKLQKRDSDCYGVRLKLPNNYQIIFSKSGYILLKLDGIFVYNSNDVPLYPKRFQFANSKKIENIFYYDQIYIRFIEHPGRLSFLFFKEGDQDIIAEATLDEFKKDDSKTTIMTATELEHFLYSIKGLKGKYILSEKYGIQYAKSKNEYIVINKNFVGFSDEDIVSKYNIYPPVCGSIAKNISQVKTPYTISYHGDKNNPNNPYLITISEEEITVCEFKVDYLGEDLFEVTTTRIDLSQEKINDMINSFMNDVEYAVEPKLDKQ